MIIVEYTRARAEHNVLLKKFQVDRYQMFLRIILSTAVVISLALSDELLWMYPAYVEFWQSSRAINAIFSVLLVLTGFSYLILLFHWAKGYRYINRLNKMIKAEEERLKAMAEEAADAERQLY